MVVGAIGTLEPLDAESAEWLTAHLRNWLARWDVRLGYTNLEGHVGKIWAGVLLSACIPFRVVAHVSSLDEGARIYLERASAVHVMDSQEPNDSWEQIQSACDVVIGMTTGPMSNSQILRSLKEACAVHCAAVLVDLEDRESRVMCRNDKW